MIGRAPGRVPGRVLGLPLREAMARTAAGHPLLDVRAMIVTDGPASGTRLIEVISGDLAVDVLPDRGLDLGQVRVAGVPLAWTSPTGFPRWSAAGDDSWSRSFGGGLLTTCGLQNFGPPSEGQPMHGRIGSIAATVTRAGTDPLDVDAPAAVVEGTVRESSLFGAHLELRRRIEMPLGERIVRVVDAVTNRDGVPAELMTLYHVNLGWPLVDEGTTVSVPSSAVRPRDEDARRGIDSWHTFPPPSTPYPEQVFEHDMPRDAPVEVVVTAPSGLSATLRFDTGELPGLFQWRVAEPTRYVLGIEPADARSIHGRAAARERGIRTLGPGETVRRTLELEVTRAPRV